MDLIQSSFQASFNARIERLAEKEASDLRTIFRYFDTDNDGALSADQAYRIFGLLGLSVSQSHVIDLDEVYLAEFLKIVDSHVPDPSCAAGELRQPTTTDRPGTSASILSNHDQINVTLPLDEEATLSRNIQIWQDEWKLLDTYNRGYVTADELRSFLNNTEAPLPHNDLVRFLELYGDWIEQDNDNEVAVLSMAGFFTFRKEWTARAIAQKHYNNAEYMDEEDNEMQDMDEGINALDGEGLEGKHTPRRKASSISNRVQSSEPPTDEIVVDTIPMEDEYGEEGDEADVLTAASS